MSKLHRKIAIYFVLLPLFYLFIPVYITLIQPHPHFFPLFFFYLTNAIVLIVLFKQKSDKKYELHYQIQKLQEKFNTLNDQNDQARKANIALQAKIADYNSLTKVVEEINENLDLDSAANTINSIAFSLIAQNKGTCLLYLVDKETQKLSLFKTKKEDRRLVVKAKDGDIFDFWVLRHTSPLFIADTKQDFRFDLEKLKSQDSRTVGSLVSAPFIAEHNFLGVLRLDNAQPQFYTQDDLRLLVTIADLGAVALENSELFQETQELAIHDGLTGLYTKGYFLDRLKDECKRGMRQNAVFSLLMIDIDHFKNYNDKFGHTAGDIVLKKISQNITKALKDLNSVISRFGGEEFCIILPGLDKKKAASTANMLRQRIEKEKIILRRNETNITVSVGVTSFPADAFEESELILKADKAMYSAKQKGRNQVCSI